MTDTKERLDEAIKARAAAVICEVGALCGWPGPDCKSREAAEALFEAGLLAASPIAPAAPSAPAGDWKANSHWYDMYCVARDEIATLTVRNAELERERDEALASNSIKGKAFAKAAADLRAAASRLAALEQEAIKQPPHKCNCRDRDADGNCTCQPAEQPDAFLRTAASYNREQPDDLRAEIERLRAELDEFKASNALKGKAFAKASARVRALEEGHG